MGGQEKGGGLKKENAARETAEGERSLARGMGRRKVWPGGKEMLDLGGPWQRGHWKGPRKGKQGSLQRWGRGKLRGAAGHARGAPREPASLGTLGGAQGGPSLRPQGLS